MRLSGGRARGITLEVPRGDRVRPATDGMRQALFSSLGARVAGARFLDLFAGSGAYGLEALSRGAAGGVFVERDFRAAACLRANIASVCRSLGRGPEGLAVVEADVLKAPLDLQGVDLIFVDPPYEIIPETAPVLFARLSEVLPAAGAPDLLVLFELPGGLELGIPGWTCVKRLGRGVRQPTVAVFRPSPGGPSPQPPPQ